MQIGNPTVLNFKLQHPSSRETSSRKHQVIFSRDYAALEFGAWNLVWMLELGIWSFRLSQPRFGILLQPIPETIKFFSDLRLDSTEFCGIEFSIARPALREKVILDLWLRSRRPHGDSRSLFEFKNQHLFFGNHVALDIFDHVHLKIFHSDYS